MSCEVTFRPRALKQLQQLPREAQARVLAEIEALAANPCPPNSKALTGPLAGLRKLRSGDYRVAYEVDEVAQFVRVLVVGHRRDVHKRLGRSGE